MEAELIKEAKVRENILDFEDALAQVPTATKGDRKDCPLKHSFADGIYVREIFIPADMLLTGKIHKHAHPNFLMKGKVKVVTEGAGEEVLEAPVSMISKAGTKRIVYTITDTVWVTVHHNPTNTQDLLVIEDNVIAKNYVEYEKFRKLADKSSSFLAIIKRAYNKLIK